MQNDFVCTTQQQAIIEAHLELVSQVISLYIRPNEGICGLGYEDLYQEGCVALCRAAAKFEEGRCQFATFARPVIRNHLYDYCRSIRAERQKLSELSMDTLTEPPDPTYEDGLDSLISDLDAAALLAHFKKEYRGAAQFGVEALAWKAQGYGGTDVARHFRVKANYVGACISRSTGKLRQERMVKDYYAACLDKEAKGA